LCGFFQGEFTGPPARRNNYEKVFKRLQQQEFDRISDDIHRARMLLQSLLSADNASHPIAAGQEVTADREEEEWKGGESVPELKVDAAEVEEQMVMLKEAEEEMMQVARAQNLTCDLGEDGVGGGEVREGKATRGSGEGLVGGNRCANASYMPADSEYESFDEVDEKGETVHVPRSLSGPSKTLPRPPAHSLVSMCLCICTCVAVCGLVGVRECHSSRLPTEKPYRIVLA
jgi:hypothetical protein